MQPARRRQTPYVFAAKNHKPFITKELVVPAKICGNCLKPGAEPTVIRHTEDMSYEGKTYPVTVDRLPVVLCPHCGEFAVGEDGLAAMDAALRNQMHQPRVPHGGGAD